MARCQLLVKWPSSDCGAGWDDWGSLDALGNVMDGVILWRGWFSRYQSHGKLGHYYCSYSTSWSRAGDSKGPTMEANLASWYSLVHTMSSWAKILEGQLELYNGLSLSSHLSNCEETCTYLGSSSPSFIVIWCLGKFYLDLCNNTMWRLWIFLGRPLAVFEQNLLLWILLFHS